jgi:phage repressor protein C with HTH and peptisase S24 domain
MAEADPRFVLERLIRERGEDYVGLSRLLGRNAAYMQQYIRRGTPKRLAEEDRRTLARYFKIDEALLGGPSAPAVPPGGGAVAVPRLRVEASAGPGAFAQDERARSHLSFDPAWLRRLAGDVRRLSMITVRGDSMSPTLKDGDEILVDEGDAGARLRDGVYVLRMDDALLVKRLSLNPSGRTITVVSDNPAYLNWPDCDPADFDIVGRVVWAGGRIA